MFKRPSRVLLSRALCSSQASPSGSFLDLRPAARSIDRLGRRSGFATVARPWTAGPLSVRFWILTES